LAIFFARTELNDATVKSHRIELMENSIQS
jgi:hypothetical protein